MPNIHLNPMPCPRPRIAVRGRFPVAYYPKTYQEWKEAAAQALLTVWTRDPLAGPLSLTVTFSVLRPKTSKLLYPKPDIDNFLKAFMDAGTQADLWDDDSQIVFAVIHKRWATTPADVGITFEIVEENHEVQAADG